MASIRERTLRDGSKAYLVRITRRKAGVSQSRQFDKRKPAETWAKNREREIDEDIKMGRKVRTRKEKRATLGQAIDAYIDGSRREMGRTKARVLLTIRNEYEVSDMACDEITTKDIVRLAEGLLSGGIPQIEREDRGEAHMCGGSEASQRIHVLANGLRDTLEAAWKVHDQLLAEASVAAQRDRLKGERERDKADAA